MVLTFRFRKKDGSFPYAPGIWNDLDIFHSSLPTFLEPFECVKADGGYIGKGPFQVKCPKKPCHPKWATCRDELCPITPRDGELVIQAVENSPWCLLWRPVHASQHFCIDCCDHPTCHKQLLEVVPGGLYQHFNLMDVFINYYYKLKMSFNCTDTEFQYF